MEVGLYSIFFNRDGSAFAFDQAAAQGNQQSFNLLPWEIPGHRIGKNGFERFAMPAVHRRQR